MFIYLSFLFLSFGGFLINGMAPFITLSFTITDYENNNLKTVSYNCFQHYFEPEHIANLNFIINNNILTHQINLTSDHSETILNLLFNPLTIDPKANNFLNMLESTAQIKEEALNIITILYEHFHIDKNITKIMEYTIKNPLFNDCQAFLKEYLSNKISNASYYKTITCNDVDICLEHIRYNNDINPNQDTINFSYLTNNHTVNFDKIYTNLINNKLAPPQNNVKTISLSISQLQGPWLKNLRMTFPNLEKIKCISDETDLKIDKDYDTFYYLVYNNNNYFNPLTIFINNHQQAKQIIKKNILIWYKYTRLAPLLLMYALLQSMGFIIFRIVLYPHTIKIPGYMIVRLLSSTTPIMSLLIGFCNASGPGGYLKDNHTWLGFNLESDYKVNKSDLIVIIPMLFALCGLLSDSMIMNISLKEFLCTQTCITLCLTGIMYSQDKFKTEYAVRYILSNNS